MYLVSSQDCPDRCLCFRTTVRCMFLQLDRIPQVPEDTTVLDLRFNKITEIPSGVFQTLPQLNTLLLNNNEIKNLQADTFHGLIELRYLYLYKNEIDHLDPHALRGLAKLEQLFLHSNKLEHIPLGFFAHTPAIQRLRLDSNALVCDCQMLWLAEMLKDQHGDTQAAATCEFPENLQGRSLMSITSEDFNCQRPHFTIEPTDVDVTFGNTVYFRCRAEGDPSPEITWLHNSNEIDPSQSRYSVLDDGTLMIEDPQNSDEGAYECIARNAAGAVNSNRVELRYLGESVAPRITDSPVDVTVSVGDTVRLPCRAIGHPVPTVRWTKNGNALPFSPKFTVASTGSLTIVNIQESDQGLFRCTAVNAIQAVSAEARLTVQVPPSFIRRPDDHEGVEGTTVVFHCEAEGHPAPVLLWLKDGEPLPNNGRFQILDAGATMRINHIEVQDRGVYSCLAESSAGSNVVRATLEVTPQSSPAIFRQTTDVTTYTSTDILLQCTTDGQPSPDFRWIKEGVSLRNGRKYSIQGSRLVVRNVTLADAGIYECFAQNSVGFSRISITLRVYESNRTFPGDNFVENAINQATHQVDSAINETLRRLFDRSRTHSVSDLLQIFRYPSAEVIELARAEEIFEHTLEIIHRHVAEGHRYNLEGHESSYHELVSPSHIALIASLAGCGHHRRSPHCNNMCLHKKYRTFDGTCNNLQNPTWGASNIALRRFLPAAYENGFNSPIGWNRAQLYNGFHLPSPRLISSLMMSTDHVTMDERNTHMVMQWGQFMDHDMDLAPQSLSFSRFSDGRDCNETCDNEYPCYPIPVPHSDNRIHDRQCLGFARSSAICNTGSTSIFFNTFSPRQQINALTSYIDGSQVYGNDEGEVERLRDLSSERGHLRTGILTDRGTRLLPFDTAGILAEVDCQIESSKRHIPCFLAGDHRVNEHPALTAMHTLWMREHNRIATELLQANPHWDGNMLYHETRKIVGAMMQHITYTQWLPVILGPIGMDQLGEYQGYNPSVDSTISNEFATAAFRFGHSLVQPIISRLNETFQPIAEGNLPLHQAFFAPYRVVEEGGIDPLLRGLFAVGHKKRMPSEIMNNELTERLFVLANAIGQDLASLNIQRGRDHGLPFYNEYRRMCNLSFAERFNDLRLEIRDRQVREKLQALYGHPDNIDLFVGGMAENPIEGSKLGPTFMCLLVDQFRRLRDGDRFWYENPGVFPPEQLVQLRQVKLARVICDSSDNINRVQPDVFMLPGSQEEYVTCDEIPSINLQTWTDCCEDCGHSGDFRSVTSHFRGRRSTEYSYREERAPPVTVNDSPVAPHHQISNTVDSSNHPHFKHQMDDMEGRIEGMEFMMEDLGKTVKQLRRKLKKMHKHMNDESQIGLRCLDQVGEVRSNRERWRINECKQCICQKGQVECETRRCALPLCDSPRKIPGHCCPVC
ncbi:hypothetical protein ScPMuIL_005534 [Solemya velum]